MRRTYHGVDANQKAIVKDLRKMVGVSVLTVNEAIDIVVGYRGRNYIFEIKNPKLRPYARKLKPSTIKFFDTWEGQRDVVMTVGDILKVLRHGE